ncbi:g3225 [Coccomyxa elongata]
MASSNSRLLRWYHACRVAVLLWFAGFKDALCIWRCVEFFVHDPRILRKTGECFGLNGAIFLGSILLWDYGLAPGMRWMLGGLRTWAGPTGAEALIALLKATFVVWWLLPVYCISFALSCVWYQELAELAVRWTRAQSGQAAAVPSAAAGPRAPLLDQMAQELYRVVLFAVFYLQVCLLGMVPYLGPALYGVMVSWLYALYSFDYRWGLSNKRLPERIAFFQQHWAFFLGFGCVCTIATCLWSFFIQAAVMNMVYPLFILVACKSEPLRTYQRVVERERAAGREVSVAPLPIFSAATHATSFILAHFLTMLQVPGWLLRNRALLLGSLAVAMLGFGLYTVAA